MIVFPKYSWFCGHFLGYLVLLGKVQPRFNHSRFCRRHGVCILCLQDCEPARALKECHSSGKVPPALHQCALQLSQKLDPLASGGLKHFATIDVKTHFRVEQKALIGAWGKAWVRDNASPVGRFVCRGFKPLFCLQVNWSIMKPPCIPFLVVLRVTTFSFPPESQL